MNREEMRIKNVRMLEETLQICEQGTYEDQNHFVALQLNKKQMKMAKVFFPENLDSLDVSNVQSFTDIKTDVVNCDSFTLARRLKKEDPHAKVLVLNLANAHHKGGGVLHGAMAQEEDLCRKSSLLLSLEGKEAAPFYHFNQRYRSSYGTDAMMISPYVEVIKDEFGATLSKTEVVSVLTCAAPCLPRGGYKVFYTKEDYEGFMRKRMFNMYKCAASQGYDTLVLGAFGCGAFQNDANDVAKLFKQALDAFDPQRFRTVDFAVLDRTYQKYNFQAFEHIFGSSR